LGISDLLSLLFSFFFSALKETINGNTIRARTIVTQAIIRGKFIPLTIIN
jgi:hypothetical protein